MTWITWRQYRLQGAVAAGLLGVVAVVLLISGLHAASVWHSVLHRCGGSACSGPFGSSITLSGSLANALVIATSAVPLLPGLLWGAPMVAHELETGTNQLAWTQSVTRRRWLAAKTGWMLLAAGVIAGIAAALVTWWSGPDHALNADAFMANRFDLIDVVPIAYAIFAMALGICAGALLRRTVPALGVTLAAFVGLRAFVAQWLRLHYMTPVTVFYKLTAPFTPAGSYLNVSQGIVGANRKFVAPNFNLPNFDGVPLPRACQSTQGVPTSCLAAHGYLGFLKYQPANRFWAFQGIEAGIFVVLAIGLLGVTFWVLDRRDA